MTDKEKFCKAAKAYISLVEKEDKIISAFENVGVYVDFEEAYNKDNYIFILENLLDDWFKDNDDKPIVEALLTIKDFGSYTTNINKTVSTAEEIYDYYKG